MTCRFLGLVLLSVAPLTGLAGPAADDPTAAWLEVADYRFVESLVKFEAVRGSEKRREVELGRALALASAGSATEADRAEATRLLQGLAKTKPHDDLSVTAVYLLGRMAQLRQPQPDWDGAVAAFRELVEQGPRGHVLVDQATVKLALILLYAPGSRSAAERLQDAEKLVPRVASPDGRRDLHLAVGHATLFFDGPAETAREHFEAALAAGILNQGNRASVLISTADLAARTGRRERAAELYRVFLAEYPRDDRNTAVRQRLEALR